MTIGELCASDSSSAFQTSLPLFLSSASTHGFPPRRTTSSFPSIRGEALVICNGSNPYSVARSLFQTTLPWRASRQKRWPRLPSTYNLPSRRIGVAFGPFSWLGVKAHRSEERRVGKGGGA